MSNLKKIIGIFCFPKKTFNSINNKPTWLIPFIIISVIGMLLNYYTTDIKIIDDIKRMEAKNIDEKHIELNRQFLDKPTKYIGTVLTPIHLLLQWLFLSIIIVLLGNKFFHKKIEFKKIFSILVWSNFIIIIGNILRTIIGIQKETTHGFTTSLALFMKTPNLNQEVTKLYIFLSNIDLFIIWQSIILILGISEIYNVSIYKSLKFILMLWVIHIILLIILIWGFSLII